MWSLLPGAILVGRRHAGAVPVQRAVPEPQDPVGVGRLRRAGRGRIGAAVAVPPGPADGGGPRAQRHPVEPHHDPDGGLGPATDDLPELSLGDEHRRPSPPDAEGRPDRGGAAFTPTAVAGAPIRACSDHRLPSLLLRPGPGPAGRPARLPAAHRPRASTPEAVVEHLLAVQAQDPKACPAQRAVPVDRPGGRRPRCGASPTARRSWSVRSSGPRCTWSPPRTSGGCTPCSPRGRSRPTRPACARRGSTSARPSEAWRSSPRPCRTARRPGTSSGTCSTRPSVPTAGQALIHVRHAAAIEGHVVRGPMIDGEQAFVHAPTWLGDPPEELRDVQLARLAERYLRGHGPANAADLAEVDRPGARRLPRRLRLHRGPHQALGRPTGWWCSPTSPSRPNCPRPGCSAASTRSSTAGPAGTCSCGTTPRW